MIDGASDDVSDGMPEGSLPPAVRKVATREVAGAEGRLVFVPTRGSRPMRAPVVEELTRWIRLTHARRAAMRAAHDATLAEGTLEALVAADNGGTNRFDQLRTTGACDIVATTTPGRAA